MKPVDILRRARAKIEQGWCQGWFAIDSDGNVVGRGEIDEIVAATREDNACRWCMIGALYAAGAEPDNLEPYIRPLRRAIGENYLPNFNDAEGRTQAQVLAMFDKAIALCEAA